MAELEALLLAAQARQGATAVSALLSVQSLATVQPVADCAVDRDADGIATEASVEALRGEMGFILLAFTVDFDLPSDLAYLISDSSQGAEYCGYVSYATQALSDTAFSGGELSGTLGLTVSAAADFGIAPTDARYLQAQLSNCALFLQTQVEPRVAVAVAAGSAITSPGSGGVQGVVGGGFGVQAPSADASGETTAYLELTRHLFFWRVAREWMASDTRALVGRCLRVLDTDTPFATSTDASGGQASGDAVQLPPARRLGGRHGRVQVSLETAIPQWLHDGCMCLS